MEKTYYRAHPSRRSFLRSYLLVFLFLLLAALLVFLDMIYLIPVRRRTLVGAFLLPAFGILLYIEIRRSSIVYRITTQGVFRSYTFLTKDLSYIPFLRMEKTTFNQSIWERTIGIGTVEVWGEDNLSITMKGVRRPQTVVGMINRLIVERHDGGVTD